MSEKLEGDLIGSETPRDFTIEEMQIIHGLAAKVRDLIGWDLAAMCTDLEQIQLVNDAKNAMKELEKMLSLPQEKYWFDEQAGEPKPAAQAQRLSADSFVKVKQRLKNHQLKNLSFESMVRSTISRHF